MIARNRVFRKCLKMTCSELISKNILRKSKKFSTIRPSNKECIMEEIISYYPKKPSWAFWKKRRVFSKTSVSESNNITRRFFDKIGRLTRMSILESTGESEYVVYYLNGQIRERTLKNEHEISSFFWDEHGMPQGETNFNQDTQIETHFYPGGRKVRKRLNRSTGAYEEFRLDGTLKRKGLWVNHKFETGNMREKSKDETRQKYNLAIDAINEKLPPVAERKMLKEAILKAFKNNYQSR